MTDKKRKRTRNKIYLLNICLKNKEYLCMYVCMYNTILKNVINIFNNNATIP